MAMHDLFKKLRHFDAYPKTLEDFRIKTFGGALVTIISAILMTVLFVSELNYYLTTEVQPELFVDTSRGQKLRINIDITFPRIACAYLSIDAMDLSGEQQVDIDHDIFKERLDLMGEKLQELPEKQNIGDKSQEFIEAVKPLDPKRCESCYGAESKEHSCCNTCEEVREAYRLKGWAFSTPQSIAQCQREGWNDKIKHQKDEGCRIYGHLMVSKVAGNFHIAPGKSFQQHHAHVHDLQEFSGLKFNMSHKMNHLSFGHDYPGLVNPLDKTQQVTDADLMMYQHFVKIVPTTYVKLGGEVQYTNQYSVTKHSKESSGLLGDQGLPGVFFLYEPSPMMVKYTEKRRSFMHFLTGVCAIIGGIFTVAGLIDSMIYHSARAIQKKIELGKTT